MYQMRHKKMIEYLEISSKELRPPGLENVKDSKESEESPACRPMTFRNTVNVSTCMSIEIWRSRCLSPILLKNNDDERKSESCRSKLDDIDIDGPGDLTKNPNESGGLPALPEGNTYSPHDPLVPWISYPMPEDSRKHKTDIVSCSDKALVNFATLFKSNSDMRIKEIPDLPHVFKFIDTMEHCSQELRPVSLTCIVISRIKLVNNNLSQVESNDNQRFTETLESLL